MIYQRRAMSKSVCLSVHWTVIYKLIRNYINSPFCHALSASLETWPRTPPAALWRTLIWTRSWNTSPGLDPRIKEAGQTTTSSSYNCVSAREFVNVYFFYMCLSLTKADYFKIFTDLWMVLFVFADDDTEYTTRTDPTGCKRNAPYKWKDVVLPTCGTLISVQKA